MYKRFILRFACFQNQLRMTDAITSLSRSSCINYMKSNIARKIVKKVNLPSTGWMSNHADPFARTWRGRGNSWPFWLLVLL